MFLLVFQGKALVGQGKWFLQAGMHYNWTQFESDYILSFGGIEGFTPAQRLGFNNIVAHQLVLSYEYELRPWLHPTAQFRYSGTGFNRGYQRDQLSLSYLHRVGIGLGASVSLTDAPAWLASVKLGFQVSGDGLLNRQFPFSDFVDEDEIAGWVGNFQLNISFPISERFFLMAYYEQGITPFLKEELNSCTRDQLSYSSRVAGIAISLKLSANSK